MASPVVASLISRWALIKQFSDDCDISESDFRRLKEQWFLEAFQFLQNAPKEEHCWCNYKEVMYPLLEPFSWYFEEPNPQSALHALWRRLCSELSACTRCVKVHHEAKEEYKKEYDEVHVEPLLAVLQVLDEERVAIQLKTLLNLIKEEMFNSMKHTAEVATVTFEVLMFPSLLEDAEVSELFAPFLQYVDDICDLVLEKGSQYPGVYSLLVHTDQKVRRVAFKLVQSLEMIKDSQEMEAIAPLLEKVMHCLEFEEFELRTSGVGYVGQIKPTVGHKEVIHSHVGKLRPRVRYKREALWLGLPNILERLLPAALEEGIVERYSVFVSIVLNHVSEARTEFYYALKCLELLLSNLGYRFWLRTTFSAGVVRNTLVSQCFHSDKQRMHASIFELFPPFLLSLETLQDEFERQRRRLLYFLLQQVPASKNFNVTMRWKARQVSFKIICSGYCMEPPLPPWECAHVWGPPLVETLKDPNMHDTFRSTAFDLIQIILAADTSALAAFSLKSEASVHPWCHLVDSGNHESGHELRAATEASRDQEYWKILKKVSDTMSEGHEKWSCVPLLWIEVLGGILAYPTSFYKSVLWAYGRIAIIDSPGSVKVLHPDVDSKVLRWETPKGYDDQSDSDSCANVVPVHQHCLQLVCTFKRYADGFRGCLDTVLHHLTLEPWFAEPLLLLLMSSNPTWKDVAQIVLIQSGASSSLESGLKLLCNSEISISAVCDAVCHASKTLLNWPLENCERAMSQLFFFGLKFLNLNQGDPATVGSESSSALQRLRETISMILWPLVGKMIMESKHLIGGNHELMLTRMLQLLPSVFKHMPISFQNALFGILNPKRNSINWFHDLLALGSLASKAVLRWWQNAVCDIVVNLVQTGSLSAALKDIISDLLKPGCPLEEDQQQRLKFLLDSASASNSHTSGVDSWTAQDKSTKFVGRGDLGPCSTTEVIDLDSEDENAQDRHHQSRVEEKDLKRLDRNLIDLERLDHVTSALSDVTVKDHKELVREGDRIEKGEVEAEDPADSVPLAALFLKPQSTPPPRIVHPQRPGPGGSKLTTLDNYVYKTPKPPAGRPVQKKRSLLPKFRATPSVSKHQVNLVNLKQPSTSKEQVSTAKQPIVAETVLKSKPQVNPNQDTLLRPLGNNAARDSAVLRELVMDDDDDLLTKALNAARKLAMRDGAVKEKRQVMTLQMPGEQIRPGIVARPVLERAPPPKLDMWFRQILSLDYFSTIGLECLWVEDRHEAAPLSKVPLTFSSVGKYKEVYQPLLLEEFKAQLGNSFKDLSVSDGKTSAVLRLMSLERVDDFQIGRFLADGQEDAARAWLENDLLLLTRYRLEPNEPQSCHLLAKVDRKEREFRGSATTILLKLCMPQGNSRLQNAKKYLVSRSKWHMTRVMSLSSQIREFQALSAVGNFPLLQTILCTSMPGKHSLGKNEKVELKGLTSDLCDRFRADYNESQVSAIAASVSQQGLAAEDHQLALVQGPPGTGKTRTIVGIVSALLAWEPQSAKAAEKDSMRVSTNARGDASWRTSVSSSVSLARAWQDAALAVEMGGKENFPGPGKAKETINRGGSRKRRILVCAQSNAAVDELVARLCKDGLYGKHGEYFRPLLVRVGNVKVVHPASMDIFIDTLVEKRLVAERNATNVEDNRQQKISLLRRKLEEVIESIQVLEASHAKRSGGDTVSKEVLSGQLANHPVQDSAEAIASPAEKEIVNAEAAKWVNRVVQEGDSAVQGKLNTLYSQRRQLSAELAHAEKDEKKFRGEEWAKRQEIRRAVIREADVVLATLNTCGADVYSACMENFVPAKKYQPRKDAEDDFFSAVVIDEAGQALEPATLIPLQLLKQTQARCVMVGDPKQLPATLLSQSASKMGFELSMFERLQRAGYPVTVLNTQYRMHPEIRRFPSAHFYNNQLTDGLAEESRQAPFHKEWCFAPYVFFDVVDGYQSAPSKSLYNDAEADAALNIYQAFQQRYPEEANSRSISVITPYKEQRRVLEDRFNRSIGAAKAFNIDFNTVDGYQGREVDILIFSTVRASGQTGEENNIKAVGRGNNSIGFVADVRRMNVALTRARFSLWIVGNATALKQNSDWAALLSDAKRRQVYFHVKSPYVFQEGAVAKIAKLTSRLQGSYLDKSIDKEANNHARANAEHIAMPRSSELGCANANPTETERVGHEHVNSKREGMGFLKASASQPRGVEKDPLQQDGSSFGAQSVERDPSLQFQQACERRIDTAADDPQMQRKNFIPRGERNSYSKTSATKNGDEDWIRRSHPDGNSALPCTKRSDEHSSPGQERPRLEDAATQQDIISSRRRIIDVDPKRRESSSSKARGSQKMAEGRSSQNAHTRTSVDGQCRNLGFSVNDRSVGLDEVKRCPSEETQTGLRKARASAVGTTAAANQDSDPPSPRARPKLSCVDVRNEQLDRSTMKATQNSSAVAGIGYDRSNETDSIERNRPGFQNQNGQSIACVSQAASLQNSRQRTGSRPDSHGRAPSSRDEGARSAPGRRSRHSPNNITSSSEIMSEWELYMRTLEEERHTGNSRERVRDRSEGVENSDSDRRTKQTGPHLDVRTRQGGRSDSDLRIHHVGKSDLDRRHTQAGKRDTDIRNNERRSVVVQPPTKKQKIAGGSSVAQSVAPVSTVDDILSGLGNLSRSQVIGSRAIDQPFNQPNTTRRL